MLDAQGGPSRCIAAEDCPRSSRVPLCIADTGDRETCIRCLDTQCVTLIPETC